MEEAQKLEERAHQLETEGWEKMREVVAGSEVEGLYGLLKGVASYSHPVPSQPPIKKPHFASSTTISQPPPQESTGPEVPEPADQVIGPASPAVPKFQWRPFQPTCNPSEFKLGALKGYISARLKIAKRVHEPHGPLSVPTSGRYT